MVTRNITITDPVGIHARPAAQFAQAVAASGCNVTIAKEGGAAVPPARFCPSWDWAFSRATPCRSPLRETTPRPLPTP